MDAQKTKSLGQTTSKLDNLIELLKKVSLFGGLVTGVGMAGFYFFGIAIYSTFNSILGIPPFDFSLQNCLEFGGASFVELITGLPLLIGVGIVDILNQADLSIYLLLGLPLVFLFLYRILNKCSGTILIRIRNVAVWLLLAYVSFLWIGFYLALLSTFFTEDLLLDPSVNIALEHREEILESMDFMKFGLHDWDEWAANIVLRDNEWIVGKIGAMYSLGGLLVLYGVLAIKTYGQMRSKLQAREKKVGKLFIYLRRVFFGAFFISMLGFLFVVPARTVVLLSLDLQKVDVSIQGLEDITSRYYLVVVGDYEKSYAFYHPNKQNVIIVQKDKVNSITLKEQVSIFADRRLFRKTPWLGVNGHWKYSPEQLGDEQKETEILGFEVVAVAPDSPALKAKILPGDILKRIGEVEIDGLRVLGDIVEGASLDEPIQLSLMRNGQLIAMSVQLEIIP